MLGHEFVGLVDAVHDAAAERWVGQRVVGEINVVPDPDAPLYGIEAAEADPTLVRNHAPDRTCLGIVGKDGAHAEYLTLPLRNLLAVPDGVSDSAAVFCEPLAAACRIVEQGLAGKRDRVAIVGDGKLGLLIAEVLDDAPASNEKLQALDLEVTLLAASYERSLIAHGKKLAKLSTREEALKVMYYVFFNSELERILF